MADKKKCYIYTRVSTSIQVEGYSLDAQLDKLRKYAEYEDMIVAGEYSDAGFPLIMIQGAAHNANDDQPDKVNAIIRDFIETTNAQTER